MNLYARRKYQKDFNLYKKLLHVKDANITITILNQLKVSKNYIHRKYMFYTRHFRLTGGIKNKQTSRRLE